ncbi:MAG: photosystem I reaction center subunit XII [Synechococcus sp. Lanier]|nr:MAG: photosystem I reaction center subunit XII [Synechococcus sp. Lanier]
MVCWSSVVTAVSQAEIYIALVVALHGAVLAMRLCVSLYRS